MIKRFEVIADYPYSKFELGDILIQYFFKSSHTDNYCYVTNLEIPLQGHNIHKDFAENMPHIFKEIEPVSTK